MAEFDDGTQTEGSIKLASNSRVTDRMVEAAFRVYVEQKSDSDAGPLHWVRAAIEAALREQPAPEPVAWMRVIDEAMVTHYLGVADPADDYETAKQKMNNLLCMAQDIGTYFAKQAEPVQEPVAWQWLDTAHFRRRLPANAEAGAWRPLYVQSGPESGHSRDLPVTPAMQDYGHLAGDKPAPNSQGAQRNGKPAQADQGVSGAFAAGDRRDERDQDDGGADRCVGGETPSAAGTGSAMDQHRRDGHAERTDGVDAGRSAANFLLTEGELRAMYSAARRSPEDEHTVWWILLCRAVERAHGIGGSDE